MVTIKYKGHRSSGLRTDGGRAITFHPGEVHTFDEKSKRYRDFVKKMLAQPDIFEVQDNVGPKDVGGGVRTRGRRPKGIGKNRKSRKHLGKGKQAAKEEVKPPRSVMDKVKKPKGLRRPKRMKL
jgi:hypothetical protein